LCSLSLSLSLCPMCYVCVYKKELIMPPRQNGRRRDTWRWLRDRRPPSTQELSRRIFDFVFLFISFLLRRWRPVPLSIKIPAAEFWILFKKKKENASWVFGCLAFIPTVILFENRSADFHPITGRRKKKECQLYKIKYKTKHTHVRI
jgi:hypothetical protein